MVVATLGPSRKNSNRGFEDILSETPSPPPGIFKLVTLPLEKPRLMEIP